MSGLPESKDDQSNAQDARTQSGMKKRKLLTQERVRELFDYNPETGIVTRKTDAGGGTRVGDIVGTSKNSWGHLRVSIDGKRYFLHRVVWLWVYGYMPEGLIDHINRKGWDNRIVNLREESDLCNARNASLRPDNKTGIKGVHFHNKTAKWLARVAINGEEKYLGVFSDFTEAVATRLAVEQCVGWIGCEEHTPAYQYMQKYLKGELNDKASD